MKISVGLACQPNELATKSKGRSIAFRVALAALPNQFATKREGGSIYF
jgi:hypothetical protein